MQTPPSVTPALPGPDTRGLRPSPVGIVTAAAIMGGYAAVLNVAIYVVAWILRVDFLVSAPGRTELAAVPILVVIAVTLMTSILGGVGAVVLSRTPKAQISVLVLGATVTITSLASPLLQPDGVSVGTRFALSLMHMVTGLVVVPQLARVAGDVREPLRDHVPTASLTEN